ncbi:hypothetical protein BJ983_003649 [Actinomycetospora corticicola]|uniref:Uncharacterized protein n=1 Tax=Actinomycetospora corticicola TaxID=663602 RepID=A0A7Y9DYH8_9PSEU|nr:hypothetical protein [Actinomycetospora corticicola]
MIRTVDDPGRELATFAPRSVVTATTVRAW